VGNVFLLPTFKLTVILEGIAQPYTFFDMNNPNHNILGDDFGFVFELASVGWVGAKRKPTLSFSLSIDFPYMLVVMIFGLRWVSLRSTHPTFHWTVIKKN